MEFVWILILTTHHSGDDLPTFLQRIVIPHQYQSEENCRVAGLKFVESDINFPNVAFMSPPDYPDGRKYDATRYGLDANCISVLVDD